MKRDLITGEPIPRKGSALSMYKPEYAERAYEFCLLGATLKRLADFFHVGIDTLNTWRREIPEFGAAVDRGGDAADAKVASALYKRAVGYTKLLQKVNGVEEVHYPPDARACFQWLACRRRMKEDDTAWQMKENNEGEGNKQPDLNDVEVARKLAFILAKAVHGETIDVPQQQQLANEE